MTHFATRNSVSHTTAQSPYFTWMRRDVLALVPEGASRILSVGCGSGMTEAELIKRGAAVVGIERDPMAAEAARSRGLTVVESDATQIAGELRGRTFDCLIYADVLEHIVDPVAVLRLHVAMLERGGTVIISVPNFRHHGVLWQLVIQGHIRYGDAGILDRTHVRITTRRMVEEWISDVGLAISEVHYLMPRRRERLIAACTLALAREFVARQVLVVANKLA